MRAITEIHSFYPNSIAFPANNLKYAVILPEKKKGLNSKIRLWK